MNKTKKSSFSNQVLETLKKILPTIQTVASNKPIELKHEGADGAIASLTCQIQNSIPNIL
jgi:hypothetical protein